jgi:hypothetical protein
MKKFHQIGEVRKKIKKTSKKVLTRDEISFTFYKT